MTKIEKVSKGKEIIIEENPFSRFLFVSTKSAWIWLILRVYLGYAWLKAGIGKVTSDAWVGSEAGTALKGFSQGVIAKAAEGEVSTSYAWFMENVVSANPVFFSYIVVYGEILVGIGLIVGCLTGIAAFFGGLMNFSFLLAGTVSTNPVMFIIAVLLVMGWKVAGWYGIDRWLLFYLGTPWKVANKPRVK